MPLTIRDICKLQTNDADSIRAEGLFIYFVLLSFCDFSIDIVELFPCFGLIYTTDIAYDTDLSCARQKLTLNSDSERLI